MTKLAFLGLGAMGSRMARRLIDAGHEVGVFNRTSAAAEPLVAVGARCFETPREAAAGARVVISMVTDDGASRSVWTDPETGALGGLEAGALAIETSTLGSVWTRELAAAVRRRGGRFLDAPVAGTLPQAEAGQLIFLVGAEDGDLAAARPVLELLGQAIHPVGPVGQGMAMKLVVNAYFGIQVAAFAEVLGLAKASEIEAGRAAEILGQLPTTGPVMGAIGADLAAGAFDPLFPIDLVVKDLAYAVAEAEAAGRAMPATRAVARAYEQAQRDGHGAANISAVAHCFP